MKGEKSMKRWKSIACCAILGIIVSVLTLPENKPSMSNCSLKQEVTTGIRDVNGKLNVSTMIIDSEGNIVSGELKCNTPYTLYITNNSNLYIDGISAMSTERNDFSLSDGLIFNIETLDSGGTLRPTVTNSFWLFDIFDFGITDSERLQINGLAPNTTISFAISFDYDSEDIPETTSCNLSFEMIFKESN